jgi:hypothetical protein
VESAGDEVEESHEVHGRDRAQGIHDLYQTLTPVAARAWDIEYNLDAPVSTIANHRHRAQLGKGLSESVATDVLSNSVGHERPAHITVDFEDSGNRKTAVTTTNRKRHRGITSN